MSTRAIRAAHTAPRDEYFSVFTELALKSEASEPANAAAKICGVISSEAVDYQGDMILQDGLDFSYFLRSGFLNDDHKAGPGNVVGEPVRVYRTEVNGKPATAMEGILYLSKPQALAIYETAKAISAAQSPRRLGFSIEGQVLARDPVNPKIIKKAKVLHVAVTHAPVNPDSKNLELISRSISSGSAVERPLILSIMEMHPELLKDDFFAALSYIRNALKLQPPAAEEGVASAATDKSSSDPRMDRESADYDSAEAAEAEAEKSEGGAVGYQAGAVPDRGLSALVPSNLREQASPSKMKQLSCAPNGGTQPSSVSAADKGCHSGYPERTTDKGTPAASAVAPAAAEYSAATPVAAKGSYAPAPEKEVDRRNTAGERYDESDPERVQESLTPILDSLTQSTISLLSENMSQMMKESVSQHFSDKKPSATITSGQLTALLQRTFPNLSESKAKNVATRLVALARKRV